MTTGAPLHALLRVLVVLQLVLGAVGLVTVDADDDPETVGADLGAGPPTADDPATTTTTAASKGASTARAGGDTSTTTTTAAASKATTTSATAGTRPAAQGLTPAKAGTYDYRTTYTDDEGSETTTGTLTFQAAKEQDGELRQTEVDVEDDFSISTDYAWRANGLYVRAATSEGETCDLEPDVLLVPSPPAVGRSWRIDTSCGEGEDALTVMGSSRTVRTERVTVAGQQIDVLVIETTVTEDDEDYTSRQSFSVERGLVVREETTYEDGTKEVQELLDIDPK